MRDGILKGTSALLIFIFSIVWMVHFASAYEFYCSNDTVKDQGTDDIEWVEFGTGDIAWKTTSLDPQYSGTPVKVQFLNESGEFENVSYVIKVNDFFMQNKMADISVSRAREGAESVHSILAVANSTNNTGDNSSAVNLTDENTTQEDQTWFQIDHELKIELTGTTEDNQGIPHAQLKYYKRGNPKLEVTIEPSTETLYNVSVGKTNYYPGKEKDILIRVKNSGEAWADSILLDIDLEGFSLSGNKTNISENSQINGRHISKKLDWIAKGEECTVNFTVVAPEWDKTSSPFNMSPCNITVDVTGSDILGYLYKGANNVSCTPVYPKPDIDISQQFYTYGFEPDEISQTDENGTESGSSLSVVNFSKSDEIYMSPWYIKGSEVRGLRNYIILRESFHNLEKYRLSNLSFILPSVPDSMLVAGFYIGDDLSSISGSRISPSGGELSVPLQGDVVFNNTLNISIPKSISGEKSYYMDCILIPIRPGSYEFKSFSASADCYGYNLSKNTTSSTLIVHGCNISVNKSIETAADSGVNMLITVKNSGDKAAIVRLNDRIPPEAGLIQNNISIWRNGHLQNTSVPLQGWELKTHNEKGSTNVSVYLPLQPNEVYSLRYSLQPENRSKMDLPYAKADFTEVDFGKMNSTDRNYYKGTVLSSFFKSGAEVKQKWDYYENRWEVTSEHWNASNGEWEEGWDPLANRWMNKTNFMSDNDTGLANTSLTALQESPKSNSTLDKIMDFFAGLMPWGNKESDPANFSAEPAQNNLGNDSTLAKVVNFITGLLPGEKQIQATSSPVQNPSNNQSSGSD